MTEKLPTPYTRAIGGVMRGLREQRNWSLDDLCRRWTVSVVTLAAYEVGTEPLTVERFDEWCILLEVLPAAVMSAARRTVTAPNDETHTRPIGTADEGNSS